MTIDHKKYWPLIHCLWNKAPTYFSLRQATATARTNDMGDKEYLLNRDFFVFWLFS